MTEKRFEMIITGMDGSFYYLDKLTGDEINSTLELENKLNDLNEENEKLKEQSDKKQKHIVHLENKIHRMRDSIKRLEVLYHYQGQDGSVDLKRECWELKQQVGQLKKENSDLKIENDGLSDTVEGLQELLTHINIEEEMG